MADRQDVTRKLAAILYADVAGYSRLTGADEEGTHGTVADYLDTISGLVSGHAGRVVHYAGDAILADFASVVTAVKCAVEIQKELAARNVDIPDERKVQFRIGVNLGDVIVDRDDIYGNGVNVAARLEGLADPGGICVSGSVLEEVHDKIDVGFEDMGPKEVKNIAKPVHTYRVILDKPSLSKPANPSLEKPSIAVLPFENLSADPEQEYFADGIAEDIITALSRFHWFFVISRNSSFTYKGKAVDVKNVARELGVRYVLEGSVRKGGDRVRVTAQLIDARIDHHVWAERFDRNLEDIFAVQDEITERIITSVAPSIVSAEMQRAHRKDIASLDAWERIMRAHRHLAHFTMEDNAEARRLLTEAAQLSPNSALALGDLAMIYLFDAQWGWGIARDQSLAAAAEAARRAVEIDEQNVWGHIALGFVELFAGRHDESIRRLERAIAISPNDPHAHGHLGFTLAFSGEPQAADMQIEKALLLSPRDPFLSLWYTARALAAFSAQRFDDAVEWAKKTLEENPRHPGGYRLLTTSYAQLGDLEEAKAALGKMLLQMPGMTITATRQQVPWKRIEDLERYLDGLRKAGLAE